MNTTTKPLFEETLNIVFECLEKYKNDKPLLPVECLKNYQLIYNEDDDSNRLLLDDNQLSMDRLSIRYAIKDSTSRTSARRTLPRLNTARTPTNPNDNINNHTILPLDHITDSTSSIADIIPLSSSKIDTIPTNSSLSSMTPLNPNIINKADDTNETIEPLKHDDDIALERLIKAKKTEKSCKLKPSLSISNLSRPNVKVNKSNFRRNIPTVNTFHIPRKKRLDLTPVFLDKKHYVQRNPIVPSSTETVKKDDKLSNSQIMSNEEEKNENGKQDDRSVVISLADIIPLKVCSTN